MQRLIHDEQNDRRATRSAAPTETQAQPVAAALDVDTTLTGYVATESELSAAQQQSIEARRRSRARALLVQPPLYWAVLMVVAAATGMLSIGNPSIRQPILLHTIPMVLSFLAGYRLKDPKQGALSGALFHVTRAILILTLSAGPQFLRVLDQYPGQLLWLFVLLPALGWMGGMVGQRVKATQGKAPGVAPAGAAGAAALIALTTFAITPRFLNPALPGGPSGPIMRMPSNPMPNLPMVPALATPVINTGSVRVGDSVYNYQAAYQQAKSFDLTNGVANADEMTVGSSPVTSADRTAQLKMDESGLQWIKNGKPAAQIASAADGPISNVSTSADGNMTVFQQNGSYMVNTPSKGTRPLEDLLRQFGDGVNLDIPDGAVTAASFNREGNRLEGRFADPNTGDPLGFNFDLNLR